MFIAQLGEAVIGTDEKIVAADVVIIVIRRTMGTERNGHSGSTAVGHCEADAARQLLRGDEPGLGQAGLVKDGIDFTLVEALAVAVKEGVLPILD